MVRQDQRHGAGDQAGDAVGVDVDRVAEAELRVRQDLPPVGVEDDVLARAEERDDGRETRDRPQVERGLQQAERRDRRHEHELGRQHPAAAAPEQRERIAVHQRGPHELPRVRQLDQREQPDRLEIDMLGAQPRRQQVDQQVEWQPRGESGKDADQHPPVEERLAPGLPDRIGRPGAGSRGRSVHRRFGHHGPGRRRGCRCASRARVAHAAIVDAPVATAFAVIRALRCARTSLPPPRRARSIARRRALRAWALPGSLIRAGSDRSRARRRDSAAA